MEAKNVSEFVFPRLHAEETFRETIFSFAGALRTFARKFSNTDFFLQILPLKDDELVMSEMFKKWGVTEVVLERTCPEEHPKSEKIRLL